MKNILNIRGHSILHLKIHILILTLLKTTTEIYEYSLAEIALEKVSACSDRNHMPDVNDTNN